VKLSHASLTKVNIHSFIHVVQYYQQQTFNAKKLTIYKYKAQVHICSVCELFVSMYDLPLQGLQLQLCRL
jgi:hypothetical protein